MKRRDDVSGVSSKPQNFGLWLRFPSGQKFHGNPAASLLVTPRACLWTLLLIGHGLVGGPWPPWPPLYPPLLARQPRLERDSALFARYPDLAELPHKL